MHASHRLLISCLLCLVALPGTAEAPPRLGDLAFLAGCWEGELGEQRVRETFTAVGGRMILATGQVFGPGATTFFEFARIEERDGEIQYVPYPSGRESVPFRLVSAEPGRAVFENPEHDFPRRITYALDPTGRLTARAEGVEHGESRVVETSMAAVACAP